VLTGTRSILRGLLSGQRIAQFVAVGVAGSATDMGALGALHGAGGVALLPAKVVAAELGILVAFALNDQWTFGSEGLAGRRALLRRLLTSNAIRVGGIAVATVILVVLNVEFGVWYVSANAAGLAAGGTVNYVLEALLAWRIHQ